MKSGLNLSMRQVAAYRATYNISSEQFGERACTWLLGFFEDEDPLVRQDASDIHWDSILGEEIDDSGFISAYVQSKAFGDKPPARLMYALEKKVSHLPKLTFAVVERIVELSEERVGNKGSDYVSALMHLSRLLIELYRGVEIGSEEEVKILDLFDSYLQKDGDLLRERLGDYDRH